MNIVYLIGNGFDLNLDLKTSYKNFIEAYSTIGSTERSQSVRDFISFLKHQEGLGNPNWSNIEDQMGQYTAIFTGSDYEEQAKSFHEDLVLALSSYIKTQCNQIVHTPEMENLFYEHLVHPERYSNLLQNEQDVLHHTFRKNWEHTSRWDLKIITFNYTNTIENLLSVNNDKPIGVFYSNSGRGKTYLTGIEHIHGFVDDRLIVGVDNVQQIANEQLRDTSAINWFVKSRGNMLTGLSHAQKCKQYISNAHLICAFGFSFGRTDQQWWKLIINRLISYNISRLIIYWYDPEISFSKLQYPRMDEYKQKKKDFFIDQSGVVLNESQRKNIKERIYIALNSTMFNFKEIQNRLNMPA